MPVHGLVHSSEPLWYFVSPLPLYRQAPPSWVFTGELGAWDGWKSVCSLRWLPGNPLCEEAQETGRKWSSQGVRGGEIGMCVWVHVSSVMVWWPVTHWNTCACTIVSKVFTLHSVCVELASHFCNEVMTNKSVNKKIVHYNNRHYKTGWLVQVSAE